MSFLTEEIARLELRIEALEARLTEVELLNEAAESRGRAFLDSLFKEVKDAG